MDQRRWGNVNSQGKSTGEKTETESAKRKIGQELICIINSAELSLLISRQICQICSSEWKVLYQAAHPQQNLTRVVQGERQWKPYTERVGSDLLPLLRGTVADTGQAVLVWHQKIQSSLAKSDVCKLRGGILERLLPVPDLTKWEQPLE